MMPRRVPEVAAVGLLVGGEFAAVVTLQRLGTDGRLAVRWTDLAGWLAETPTDDVLVAVVRVVALGVAWWLLASTALYLSASLLRAPRLVRGVEWAAVPGVRRIVDGLVAGSIVASSALGSAAPAAAQAPASVPDHAYVPQPAADGPVYTPLPAGAGLPVVAPAVVAPQARPQPPARGHHRVRSGENLWSIAEDHLANATGESAKPGVADVHPHWLGLIEENRDRLASGDPDLIYPGEEVVLPEVDEQP